MSAVHYALKKSVDNFNGASVAGFDARAVDVGKLLEDGDGVITVDQDARTVNGEEMDQYDNGAALLAALDSLDVLKRTSGKGLDEAAETLEAATDGPSPEGSSEDAPDPKGQTPPQANVGSGSGARTRR